MKVTEVGKKSSFNIFALRTHASPSSSTSLTQFTQHREADGGAAMASHTVARSGVEMLDV